MNIKRAFRVWQRHMTVYRKLFFSSLVLNFAEPVIYLAAMGIGMGAYVSSMDGMPYIEFLAPGVVAYSGLFAAAFECTYGTYVRMSMQRTFDAILATPVGLADLIAGEVLWGATKGVIYGIIILIVVIGFGLVDSWAIVFAIPFLFLGAIIFAECSVMCAALVPSIEYFNYYFTLFLTPMFMFSGVFFPLDKLHPVLQKAAFFSPLHHMVQITRGLSQGQVRWEAMLWITVAAIILAPYPYRLMKRRMEKDVLGALGG